MTQSWHNHDYPAPVAACKCMWINDIVLKNQNPDIRRKHNAYPRCQRGSRAFCKYGNQNKHVFKHVETPLADKNPLRTNETFKSLMRFNFNNSMRMPYLQHNKTIYRLVWVESKLYCVWCNLLLLKVDRLIWRSWLFARVNGEDCQCPTEGRCFFLVVSACRRSAHAEIVLN